MYHEAGELVDSGLDVNSAFKSTDQILNNNMASLLCYMIL